MKEQVEVKCLSCGELFMSESKFIRRCPACKKLHTHDPVLYSFNFPYNREMQRYGT